jgi:16S rRNA (guanine966-N2)-methyltransferase
MRVIAGIAKGRRLVGPTGRDTRPMTGRAKEAIFSSLGPQVEGTRVLDLYAGSGSLGIEALSRGAASAVFVEKSRRALRALQTNLENCRLNTATVVTQDARVFLRNSTDRFDLVFIDPPWDLATEAVAAVLQLVDLVADDDCQVVLGRRWSDPCPDPENGWRLDTTRRYGDGKICRYMKETR